jgi:hypothetical protein
MAEATSHGLWANSVRSMAEFDGLVVPMAAHLYATLNGVVPK